MYNVAAMDLVELSQREYVKTNGGGEPVTSTMLAATLLIMGTLAGSFKWGWDNLGPIFNRWI